MKAAQERAEHMAAKMGAAFAQGANQANAYGNQQNDSNIGMMGTGMAHGQMGMPGQIQMQG